MILGEGKPSATSWQVEPIAHLILAEAKRRCIDREGSDEAARSFWHERMAQELPFVARQRPWDWADVFGAGTPECPQDSATSVLTAAPAPRRRDGSCIINDGRQ